MKVGNYFSVNSENSPAVFHFAHAELPAQIVALDEINGRYPGTLGHTEVVNQDGVTHVHLIERITANLSHGNAGFWGVNGHHGFNLVNSVHHESETAGKSLALLP